MSLSSQRFRASLTLLALCTACPLTEGEPGDASTGDVDPGESSSSDVDPGDSSSADSSSDDGGPVPTDCPEPTAGPTMHPGNNVESDELWTADGSPHLVPYDFTISARVVVEPCARVQLGDSLTLTLVDGGELVAEGEAAQPIVFERLDAEPWTSIRLLGGTASLAHAILEGGGKTGNTLPDLTGALLVRGRATATATEGTLAVSHVEIRGSQSAGVRVEGFGGFTADSDDLVITAGESHPISMAATAVGTIPAGTYTGNGDDQIVLTTTNTEGISSDATMRNHGVPYYVGLPGQVGDLRVQGPVGGLATLTIEPGVVMRFPRGGSMSVHYGSGGLPATGALVAVGTQDARIVLTSAEDAPAAGDWLGLSFGGDLHGSDVVDYLQIEYAGGAATGGSNSCPYPNLPINDAAIRIFGVPPGSFITNTVIVASAAHGIDRGWRDDYTADFLDTNDFDVALCRETVSRTADGVCPDPVPCD